MKITPETQPDLVAIIASEFKSFGGGGGTTGNLIFDPLKDRPPMFALGVDITDVVRRVIELAREHSISNIKYNYWGEDI